MQFVSVCVTFVNQQENVKRISAKEDRRKAARCIESASRPRSHNRSLSHWENRDLLTSHGCGKDGGNKSEVWWRKIHIKRYKLHTFPLNHSSKCQMFSYFIVFFSFESIPVGNYLWYLLCTFHHPQWCSYLSNNYVFLKLATQFYWDKAAKFYFSSIKLPVF